MITAISYANVKFIPHQLFHAFTAKFVGKADRVIMYGPKSIDNEFRAKHERILSCPRGAGLWLWKPYVCLKALSGMNNGDYLFYADSGSYYVDRLSFLRDWMTRNSCDLLPFSLHLIEKFYTKQSLFSLLGCDGVEYRDTWQVLATCFMVRKTSETVDFFSEYLRLAGLPGVLEDPGSHEEQLDGFVAHRHDQSLFSLLCKKHGLKAWRDPSEWGDTQLDLFGAGLADPLNAQTAQRVLDSRYPRVLELCRRRNPFFHKFKLLRHQWQEKNA